MIGFTLVAVFIAAFGLVLGTYVFVGRQALARRATARKRLQHVPSSDIPASLLKDRSVSDIAVLNKWLEKNARTINLQRDLKAAGIEIRVGSLLMLAGLLGLLGFLLGNLQGNPLAGIIYVVLGVIAPFLYVRYKKRKRIEAFEGQLPDALDMIINAMRAGYSFQAAMELVGQELPDPLGPEFSQFYEEQRLGMDVRTALLGLQDRVPSMDLKMFITAVMINRETGGNLTEVLNNIATVIRERFRIEGELRTLTAQVKLSSKILGLLPILVVAAITLLNPEFMKPLFEEEIGKIIIAVAATMQLFGFLVMRKLSNIEI